MRFHRALLPAALAIAALTSCATRHEKDRPPAGAAAAAAAAAGNPATSSADDPRGAVSRWDARRHETESGRLDGRASAETERAIEARESLDPGPVRPRRATAFTPGQTPGTAGAGGTADAEGGASRVKVEPGTSGEEETEDPGRAESSPGTGPKSQFIPVGPSAPNQGE